MVHQPQEASRGSTNATSYHMPSFSYQSVTDDARPKAGQRTDYYCKVCSCRVPEVGRKSHDAGRRHKHNLQKRNGASNSSVTNTQSMSQPKVPSTTNVPQQRSDSPLAAPNANANQPSNPSRSITGANLSALTPLSADLSLPLLGPDERDDLPQPAALPSSAPAAVSTGKAPSTHQPFARCDPWALDYGRILAAAQSLQPN
ncbi:hypothetical protein H4R35_003400 [Dimargaris xerosporica]|nr:hypothetical protein H4R35_003400 [Dimargaris xerosporica]